MNFSSLSSLFVSFLSMKLVIADKPISTCKFWIYIPAIKGDPAIYTNTRLSECTVTDPGDLARYCSNPQVSFVPTKEQQITVEVGDTALMLHTTIYFKARGFQYGWLEYGKHHLDFQDADQCELSWWDNGQVQAIGCHINFVPGDPDFTPPDTIQW